MLCDVCDVHVDLRALADHRRYHDALTTMKYKPTSRPESTAKLMQRRRAILRKIKQLQGANDPPIDSDVIHKINDAYEFLKADLEETYDAFRKVKESVSTEVEAVAVNSGLDGVLAVGMCSGANSRWKSTMEDARVFQDCLGGDPSKAFVGLYDGHHGPFAAESAAQELHHALLHEMAKFDQKIKWDDAHANRAHSKLDFPEDDPWHNDDDQDDEGEILQDGGVCAINQVIRGHEEKMERLRKQREKAREIGEPEPENKTEKETLERDTKKSARKKKYGNAYSEQVESAFNQAYKYTDLLLSWGKEEQSRVRWSGCSLFTGLIEQTNEQLSTQDKKEDEKATHEPREWGRLHLAHAGRCLNVKQVLMSILYFFYFIRGDVVKRYSIGDKF